MSEGFFCGEAFGEKMGGGGILELGGLGLVEKEVVEERGIVWAEGILRGIEKRKSCSDSLVKDYNYLQLAYPLSS